MTPKTKNLITRTLAGAVYVALMVGGTFCFPLMAVLMCVVSCLGICEFSKIVSGPVDRLTRGLSLCLAIVLFVWIGYWGMTAKGNFFVRPGELTLWYFYLSIPLFLMTYTTIMSVAELFRHRPVPVEQISKGIFGIIWIVLPLAALLVFSNLNARIVLAFLIMIWMYDTFAYLGGSLYGRNKMCPHISPGKTWEGTFTGFVLTIILAIVLSQIPFFAVICPEMWKWAVLAIIVCLFGTFGDLLESLFKRNAGVKDSGNAIPGHGGILDRFDSILFATIPVLVYFLTVMI